MGFRILLYLDLFRRIQICMMWKWLIAHIQSINFASDWANKTHRNWCGSRGPAPASPGSCPRYGGGLRAVLRIWIRIRIWIRGSMPLTNKSGSGSVCGSGSCYFRHWPSQDANKKQIFKKVFLLITFWRYMYIIFKIKSQKEVTNQ